MDGSEQTAIEVFRGISGKIKYFRQYLLTVDIEGTEVPPQKLTKTS